MRKKIVLLITTIFVCIIATIVLFGFELIRQSKSSSCNNLKATLFNKEFTSKISGTSQKIGLLLTEEKEKQWVLGYAPRSTTETKYTKCQLSIDSVAVPEIQNEKMQKIDLPSGITFQIVLINGQKTEQVGEITVGMIIYKDISDHSDFSIDEKINILLHTIAFTQSETSQFKISLPQKMKEKHSSIFVTKVNGKPVSSDRVIFVFDTQTQKWGAK